MSGGAVGHTASVGVGAVSQCWCGAVGHTASVSVRSCWWGAVGHTAGGVAHDWCQCRCGAMGCTVGGRPLVTLWVTDVRPAASGEGCHH